MTTNAPGGPGIPPTWTSSAKDMVGTALGPSRLWFTTGYGIVNEVYFPHVDMPQIRDLGFIVADGRGFWVEVKRNADYTLTTPGPGIPAVQILHRHARFELSLRIAPDLERDVLLVEAILTGDPELRLHALLAPHLGGTGEDNRGEVFMNRDRKVLCAERGAFALALAAADAVSQHDAWRRASAGFVGASDGWQDFAANGAMAWTYDQAGPGNIALLGELGSRTAVLALGFGSDKEAAATLAISALIQPFDAVWHRHVRGWEAWHAESLDLGRCHGEFRDAVLVSAMVLRTHQDKTFRGAMVASLSIPWGNSSDDTGGYHLVWPRDLVETAGALLAYGSVDAARDILRYLIATQLADGRWSQNQWLGGRPRWLGTQLDEVAFPVLLASALAEADALGGIAVSTMVRRALGFIALHGPATDQDRWEETPGVNTFTLSVAIAALVCGAELLGAEERRDILLLADDWNERIESWCTAGHPALVARHGVERYYVRAAPATVFQDRAAIREPVPVKNHDGECLVPADTLIGTDFLQLVRFGLRRPDDPTVTSTLALVDAMLRVDTPAGPSWYRYNGDGYGEHEDGRPYDGTGRGRAWPLLTGERGHYELAAGRPAGARALLRAMIGMGSPSGLIPEQVWEAAPIPAQRLFPGRPSGSAMPLVWAHAEFMKLTASLQLGRPVDRPEPVWLRYGGNRPAASRAHWTRRMPVGWIRAGQGLRLALETPSLIHWGLDDWQNPRDVPTVAGALGLHLADLATEGLEVGRRIVFSIQELESGRWIEQDRAIVIASDEAPSSATAPPLARDRAQHAEIASQLSAEMAP
ncbi:glycoside hydrolase family 15 protein [Siccirubricoccus sp. KC 17139]|uniref:Glycoside hydrolase family 15 protein n=1 Tax=Siccirubricoccus soli TaxID=2899147 RepID=A0ABT1D644_9PROT|nr:glycoside hydrolase family 15 protein [Siccirubricoccus soli]MCO6417402.1 glycoside hydrolase family 15 protein [Siccirubricoccus soli]MCP2683537.1 glycoside hydrolase family 15 protein [Siccirubricoccus soli]